MKTPLLYHPYHFLQVSHEYHLLANKGIYEANLHFMMIPWNTKALKELTTEVTDHMHLLTEAKNVHLFN